MSNATANRAPRPTGVAEVISLSCVWLLALCCSATAADEQVDFGKQIEPIIEQHCMRCHWPGNSNGRETAVTHKQYGTQDENPLKAAYARNCLLARQLLERGVHYVNLYCASRASGVDGLLNWDAHKKLKADYERHCPIFDQSGLLDDTLVLWTTEFGRMPTHQAGTAGRDHNPDGFTCWMMGAGIKGGVSYGATEEFGRRAEVNPTTVWDFYATVLHLLGFEHEKLTWYHNGFDRRLTDVHGHVIKEILA